MSVRFAPSPTGPFHVGNLRTAWVSREWARRLGLPWVVRFENIDGPRNVPGALERQLGDMRLLGLEPDRVLLQSESRERHWEVFLKFQEEGLLYPCFCSRKTIREEAESSASAPHGTVPAYTGRCRDLKDRPRTDPPALAWRIRREDPSGRGDFVVARTGTTGKAAFAPAYHWACAIDDYDGDHALLVRAWDLEDAAVLQGFIHEKLAGLEGSRKKYPAVFHCRLVTADDGRRLEKRTPGATFPEILSAGHTPEGLVEKFKRSFQGEWSVFESGKIFGEGSKTLTLAELGI